MTGSAGKWSRPVVGFWAGLLVFAAFLFAPAPENMPLPAHRTAAVTLLMVTWWISEALPIAVTALLPLALFPLLGVQSAAQTAAPYADHNIFLFFGGFCIALAMEKWNLHRRMALHVIALVGYRPRQLILGFMVATAAISMWVSNSATAMMMMPIGLAVVQHLTHSKEASPFGGALMLAVAYGASIGGMGTLIGTPPNLVFAGQIGMLFPDAPAFGFMRWMMMALPLVLVFLPLAWLYLAFVIYKPMPMTSESRDVIRQGISEMGPLSPEERLTLMVFVATCLAWITRQDIPIGRIVLPGWTSLLESPAYVQDSTIAMTAALMLFLLPVDFKKRRFVLDWPSLSGMPWGILLLFGGGFSLAEAFVGSGLASWIGGLFLQFNGVSTMGLMLGTCLLTMAITEMTSNTATATMILPVVASAAISMGLHPFTLMIPAALSASCAFMLPVSTPPNAIVFGSGQLSIPQMAKSGLTLNLIAALLIVGLMYVVVAPGLSIDLNAVPSWAVKPPAGP